MAYHKDKSNRAEFSFVENCINLLKIENINKINKMRDFKDDWNGYGASAFSEESIKYFLKIMDTVSKQPKIAPTGRNSLLMQYELDDRSKLVAFVDGKATAALFIEAGGVIHLLPPLPV